MAPQFDTAMSSPDLLSFFAKQTARQKILKSDTTRDVSKELEELQTLISTVYAEMNKRGYKLLHEDKIFLKN